MNHFNPSMTAANLAADGPSDDWRPRNYLLRLAITTCECCQERHQSSSLWKVSINRKHPTVTREAPLLDLAALVDRLPVVKITSEKTQPVCHLCMDIAFELGYINPPREVNEREWKAALTASERALTTTAKPKPTPIAVNLGDLL